MSRFASYDLSRNDSQTTLSTYVSGDNYDVKTLLSSHFHNTYRRRRKNGCFQCLRSSPCTSLFGLVTCFFGLGCTCGGVIFGIDFTTRALKTNPFSANLDIIVYAITGITALFVLMAYLLCVVCSGSNMQYVFSRESRVKVGRIINVMFIIGCVFGVLSWTGATCCIWTPLYVICCISNRGLSYNNKDVLVHDLSYFGLFSGNNTLTELSHARFYYFYEGLVVSYAMAVVGCFLIIFGFVHIGICCAINYVRLQDIELHGLGITRENGQQANTHL